MSQRQGKRNRTLKKPRQRRGDYRIFVGAFPEGELAEQIQLMREKYDWKTSQITSPHVTIAGSYWRSGPPTPTSEARLIRRLVGVAARIPAFELRLGGIYTFGRRVVYLGVQPTETLLSARKILLDQIGPDKHRRYRPHLTLAMRLPTAATDEMVEELSGTEWHNGRFTAPIGELCLMQRGPGDPAWRVISRMPLRK